VGLSRDPDWYVMNPRNVGGVASRGISNVTVRLNRRRRETGGRPEVARPLGEMRRWTPKNYSGTP
jgi:hypothetical protein